MPRFTVTVERTREITETIEIEVSARDVETAEELAVEIASKKKDEDWDVQSEEVTDILSTDVGSD